MSNNKLEPVLLAAWVSPHLKERLRDAARQSDRSMSSDMRRCLEEYLANGIVMAEARQLETERCRSWS